jgi:hypothetical protein
VGAQSGRAAGAPNGITPYSRATIMGVTITQAYSNTPGSLPLSSGSFVYNGGTQVLITVSGSGWAPSGAGLIGMTVGMIRAGITDTLVAISQVYTNASGDHRAFVPVTVSVPVSTLVSGTTYPLYLGMLGNTSTDFNDFYNVTVVEIDD